MKKLILYLIIACSLLSVIAAGCTASGDQDILFQTSPFIALQQGDYDGVYKCSDLKKHGDYGLGTFDDLDGEMIMVEGEIYQVKTDGIAYLMNDNEETPFAAVTFFHGDKTINMENIESSAQLQQAIDQKLVTENTFYAIRIEGTFDYIKARSVPEQYKPYPSLVDAVQEQTIFEFKDIEGTIIGLRCPPYIGALNVAGYHFHFITADRKAGGHLLDCRMHNAVAEIDETNEYQLLIPVTEDFIDMNLTQQNSADIDKIEK